MNSIKNDDRLIFEVLDGEDLLIWIFLRKLQNNLNKETHLRFLPLTHVVLLVF
jgi:hypothetical protein